MRVSGLPFGAPILALSALVLAACTSVPYPAATPKSIERQLKLELGETLPDQSETVTSPRRRPVSLCYSRAFNTPKEVLAKAKSMCGDGSVEFVETDIFWTPCSLQQPVRATFMCTPEQSAGDAPPAQ